MLPYQDRKRVMLWVQEAFLKTKEHDLLRGLVFVQLRNSLSLEWSTKMSRTMGLALYRPDKAWIRLSTILWEAAPEDQKRETVFHEFAHLVVSADRIDRGHFRSGYRDSHGGEWRNVMLKFGYPNADRCHSVINEEYERSRGKVPLYCKCDTTYWTTEARAKRAMIYLSRCSQCKNYFSLSGAKS